MMIPVRARDWLTANWFLVTAPALGAAAWVGTRSAFTGAHPSTIEAALLFDACVTLPALYALCYGRSLVLWQLVLRMVGIACLGIYIAGLIVPAEAQSLLPTFGWARIAGLGLLILIELRALFVVFGLLFRSDATAEDLSRRSGLPLLAARLMLLEARMWKRLARFLRGG